MNHNLLLCVSLAIAVSLWSGTTMAQQSQPVATGDVATGDQASDQKDTQKEIVQKDVRSVINALHAADVDAVLGYTHPKIIKLLGGSAKAKSTVKTMLSKFQSLGIKLESMKFSADPTFLKTDVNHYVIVPTLSVLSANGQKVESLNYQFGIRKIGTTKWTYIEGSRINKKNVKTLFSDFPDDYEFPKFYRKKI